MRAALALCVLLLLATEGSAAYLHGQVFEWSTLEPLNNVIVDVNSTPPQRVVSKDGAYAFELPPGDYLLKADYFEQGERKYETEERLRVEGEGRFVFDLVMLPVLGAFGNGGLEDDGLGQGVGVDELPKAEPKPALDAEKMKDRLLIGILAILILSAVAEHTLSSSFLREQKEKMQQGLRQRYEIIEEELAKPALGGRKSEGKAAAGKDQGKLDDDAREVLDTLKRSGNRLTQKELRDRLQGLGEAKISLIVSELEALGKIRKIKQGRGNILVVREEKD